MKTPAMAALIGESPVMQKLRATIAAAARTRLSVLIEGPTGSGKELVAAAVHDSSGRKGRFVAFNVAAIGDSMFEDALFGHVRGAFTGACGDSVGLLREADGGTAFFDEISGLPIALQVKLLRAIETGQFRPLGARADCRSDFRVIAATNEPARDLVESRLFRSDLLHRICAVRIQVPDLESRIEDVPALVRHFLDAAGFDRLAASSDALRALQERRWPGNVRELKHTVEWAAALANGVIDVTVLDAAMIDRGGHAMVNVEPLRERLVLCDVLARHDWDMERTALELGIHRATLYRRMKRLRVSPPDSLGRGLDDDRGSAARAG
jgi:DNA-binding NtrC family response regulator